MTPQYAGTKALSPSSGVDLDANLADSRVTYVGTFAADDFAVQNGAAITGMKWWGGYVVHPEITLPALGNVQILPNVDRFLITIHSDTNDSPGLNGDRPDDTFDPRNPHSPGRVVYSTVVTRNNTVANGNFTEQAVNGRQGLLGDGSIDVAGLTNNLYEYEAKFSDGGFQADANTRYWISVKAISDIEVLGRPVVPQLVPENIWGWHTRNYNDPNLLAPQGGDFENPISTAAANTVAFVDAQLNLNIADIQAQISTLSAVDQIAANVTLQAIINLIGNEGVLNVQLAVDTNQIGLPETIYGFGAKSVVGNQTLDIDLLNSLIPTLDPASLVGSDYLAELLLLGTLVGDGPGLLGAEVDTTNPFGALISMNLLNGALNPLLNTLNGLVPLNDMLDVELGVLPGIGVFGKDLAFELVSNPGSTNEPALVPEPTTASLAAFSLAALLMRRRVRRRPA